MQYHGAPANRPAREPFPMSDLLYQSALALARRIRRRDVSAREVVAAHLQRITEVEERINAVTERLDVEALAAADAADAALARGEAVGPFHGVPVTIKECLSLAGKRTTCGTPLLENYVPDRDATAVARLKAAGAIPIGRTNLPEWAMDMQSSNPLFGRTNNPWNLERTSGGSSGGEGAAIAAGVSPLGLGSDVAGSIRIPAHFCGVCGVKPTAGRVPVTGHVPEAMYEYEQIGALARDIDDLAVALEVISGPDQLDPCTVPVPFDDARFDDLEGMHVAYMLGDGTIPVTRDTRDTILKAAGLAEELGAAVTEAMPPNLETILPVATALLGIDQLYVYEHVIKGHEEGMEPYLHALLELMDPDATVLDLAGAVVQHRRLKRGVMQFFERYDLLLCPVLPIPAIPHGYRPMTQVDDREVMYFGVGTLTVLWNLTGNPALVVPMHVGAEGLPIGVQIVAPHWDEPTQFMVGKLLLEAAGGVPRPPDF